MLGAVGAATGALRHRFAVVNWLAAAFRAHSAGGLQDAPTPAQALPRTMPTGEVVATVASDAMRVGGLYDTSARFIGAIVSYVVVAALLLAASTAARPGSSWSACRCCVATLSLLLRPLQRRQALQREESGRLTTLGADTVAGLRVLRGIGGEQTFLRRYEEQSQRVRVVGTRVAGIQADPGRGPGAAARHLRRPRHLARCPLRRSTARSAPASSSRSTATPRSSSSRCARPPSSPTGPPARYIGARKIIRVLQVEPDTTDGADARRAEPPAGRRARPTRVSDVTVAPGRLTAVVSGRPQDSAALADRLGRFGPLRTPVTAGRRAAGRPAAARWSAAASSSARTTPACSPARCATSSTRAGAHDDDAILAMLTVASGEDILERCPRGSTARSRSAGRSFSGGQRQRLALVRALLTDAETLVLVEPTSAVDAHTESRIAGRLAQARPGGPRSS